MLLSNENPSQLLMTFEVCQGLPVKIVIWDLDMDTSKPWPYFLFFSLEGWFCSFFSTCLPGMFPGQFIFGYSNTWCNCSSDSSWVWKRNEVVTVPDCLISLPQGRWTSCMGMEKEVGTSSHSYCSLIQATQLSSALRKAVISYGKGQVDFPRHLGWHVYLPELSIWTKFGDFGGFTIRYENILLQFDILQWSFCINMAWHFKRGTRTWSNFWNFILNNYSHYLCSLVDFLIYYKM